MALTQQDKEEMYQYLITRGKALGSLDEGDSNLSNKYLAPVLEYSGGTASKAVRLAVSLLQGKSAVLRKSGDLVQWQLQGASTWETLYSMADYKGLPGTNGKNPVFRKNSTSLEYKLDGEEDTAYKLLVALSDITGPEGDHVVLRVLDGKLEYKQSKAADSTYQQLLIIEDMRGPQGRPGKDFQILGYYDTIADLRTAITSPEPGEAYGVGIAAPYPIYIWDAVSQDWVNNGAIQGPAGRSGKSARVNTDTGYWEEFDDDTQTWKQTEALGEYNVATTERDGLMSKDDKAKLDKMKGGDIEVSKANVEKVLIGDIASHTHDRLIEVTNMPTDVWDGVTVSTSLAGSGTVADPYLIQSCADYIHFYRNPKLYGHDMDFDAGPTPEQLANPKQMKFTSNLDFNNVVVDFGDTVPDIKSDAPENMLVLCYIDGQGCNISNVNFVGTWAVIPIAGYSAIKNIHVLRGIFTIPLSTVNDKGFASTNDASTYLTPWGLFAEMVEVENVSFVAEVKFTGDIELQMYFVGGAVVYSLLGAIPGFLGEKPYFYSNVTFSGDEGRTKLSVVAFIPALVSYEDSAIIPVTGYDLTPTLKESDPEPTSGIVSAKMIDPVGSKAYTLYINTDDGYPVYNSDSTTPFHISKTYAEMKSVDFVTLLNGDMETFVADTDNVNDGYPVFKPNKVEQVVYDGYVKESTFEAFKSNVSSGSGNVYNLDIDIAGEISKLDADLQILAWGKAYTAPTNDNIVELLGGTDGIRQLCEKLALVNNPVVTVPFLAVYFPARLVSSFVMFAIMESSMGKIIPKLSDGCAIIMGFEFNFMMNSIINVIDVSIQISNFNTSTQSATYTYNIIEQGGSSTEVLDYLTSTNSGAALSANQGRVLKGMIDNISGATVENSLTSSSTTAALSANQGKILKGLVDGKIASTEITTIKKLTQSAYDALSSKDSKTLYVIV